MFRRALHHCRKEQSEDAHDASLHSSPASPEAASPPDVNLPKASDRKAILGCLAAVLASMYSHEADDGDEKQFFRAYDAHCTVHTEYEKRSDSTTSDGAGRGSAAARANETNDDDDDELAGADDFSLNDIFGNRAKLRIAVSRHKRRKYEVKMDLLRWSTRLLMLDEADATALIPMLKPLLVMGEDPREQNNFRVDEILKPFLSSLSSGRAAFECMALLLFNYLLLSATMSASSAEADEGAGSRWRSSSSSNDSSRYSGHEEFVGYDARIRHAFKRLAMAVFSHVMMKDYLENVGAVAAERVERKLSSESAESSGSSGRGPADETKDDDWRGANAEEADAEAREEEEAGALAGAEGAAEAEVEVDASFSPPTQDDEAQTEAEGRGSSDANDEISGTRSQENAAEEEAEADADADTSASSPTQDDEAQTEAEGRGSGSSDAKDETLETRSQEISAESVSEAKKEAKVVVGPPSRARVSNFEAAATRKLEAIEHSITSKFLALSGAMGQQQQTRAAAAANKDGGGNSCAEISQGNAVEAESNAEVDNPSRTRVSDVEAAAIRKFEALEHTITAKLLALSQAMGEADVAAAANHDGSGAQQHKRNGSDQLLFAWKRKDMTWERGLRRVAKVGAAGVLAGAVFGLTGGLAAPGIAAFATMVAGGAAATAAVVTLTSTLTVATLFGVTGGVLCAAKVTNRLEGLKEFCFTKECHKGDAKMELSRAVCVSGWIRDTNDFRRPWGVPPGPETTTREKLERFYSVHFPEKLSQCEVIAEDWKGKEEELWELLRDTYGQDPDTLLPFKGGLREAALLCDAENDAVDDIMEALGYSASTKQYDSSRDGDAEVEIDERGDAKKSSSRSDDSLKRQPSTESFLRLPALTKEPERLQVSVDCRVKEESDVPAHLGTFWDYHSKYGGELYTVRWESELLTKLTTSVARISGEFASSATLQVLNETALNALTAGLSLPSNLIRTLKVIDGPWALACKRAEQAGKYLARSLLESDSGHRPVTLVGFSLGARLVYSCLKELALHQERWELQREQRKKGKTKQKDVSTRSAAKAPIQGGKIEEKKEEDDSVSADEFLPPEIDVVDGPIEDPGKEKKVEAPSSQLEEFTYLREPASIVEDAILIGCPVYIDLPTLAALRRVVAGRMANCFHPRDMVLLLIYQYECISGLLRPTCGTHEINLPGFENYNISKLVPYHNDYCFAMDSILSLVRYGQPEMLLNTRDYIKGNDDRGDDVSTGADDFSHEGDNDEESLAGEDLDEDNPGSIEEKLDGDEVTEKGAEDFEQNLDNGGEKAMPDEDLREDHDTF